MVACQLLKRGIQMDFKMFDVEHGFCALVTTDEERLILIECGHNASTGFTPTKYLQKQGIRSLDALWISNFDEDHISDLANLHAKIAIGSLWKNGSVSAAILETIKNKSGPISENMEALLNMMRDYIVPSTVRETKQHDEHILFNSFPSFTDTNNLSALYFLFYRDVRIAYGGDLETAGWESLLDKAECREYLRDVNIFIATHHGRTSGYCPKVFEYCRPEVVLISDKEIVHETQKQDYHRHASGIRIAGKTRHVLTTRNDGRIGIKQSLFNRREFYIG